MNSNNIIITNVVVNFNEDSKIDCTISYTGKSLTSQMWGELVNTDMTFKNQNKKHEASFSFYSGKRLVNVLKVTLGKGILDNSHEWVLLKENINE